MVFLTRTPYLQFDTFLDYQFFQNIQNRFKHSARPEAHLKHNRTCTMELFMRK